MIIRMHTCVHKYIHAYINTYILTYLHAYIHAYIYTYMRTYMHTYVHTYIHTFNLTVIIHNSTAFVCDGGSADGVAVEKYHISNTGNLSIINIIHQH
jgi:hypothetical protein